MSGFDDLKPSLGIDAPRCKSPHMATRERLILTAYNLVRHLYNHTDDPAHAS